MSFRFADFLSCILIVAFAFFMFHPIFADGFLVSLDNPIHLAESYSFVENLKENKWVSGWSMDAYVGYPLQLFPRYQVGLWLVAILNLVFSVEFAYKIVLFLSYLFPALAIFFVCRKLFDSTFSALLPSVLFLLIRRDVVVTALTGQWNSLLALGFLIVFIYLVHRFFFKPDLRSSIVLAFVFALIVLSHPFAAFAGGLFFLIYFVVFSFKKYFSFRRLFLGVLFFVLGVLLCGFYLLPILDVGNWLDTQIGWPPTYNALALPYKVLAPFVFAVPKGVVTSELFASFSQDLFLFVKLSWLYVVASLPQSLIFVLGVLGVIVLFEGWNKKDSVTVFLVSLFIFMVLCLIIGSGFWFLVPGLENLPLLSNFQSYRFLIYSNFALLVFASFALFNILKGSYPRTLAFLHPLFRKKFLIFVLLVLFFFANITSYLPDRPETITIQDDVIRNDFFSLADWIKGNVDSDATRIVYQDFYGNVDDSLVGSSHLPSMFFHYTNVNSVGGWYQSSSYPTDMLSFTASGNFLGRKLDDATDTFISGRMMLVNAKYVVAVNGALEDKLSSSALFQREFSNNRFAVFSLNRYDPEWISYYGNFSYNMLAFDNQLVLFNYNSSEDKEVLLKVTYHPYWHAYVDEEEIQISRSPDGLIVLDLPSGHHDVLLSYRPFRWSYLIVTLTTAILCLFALLFLRD